MNIDDLFIAVEHELDWLSYYATLESRQSLDLDGRIYQQLKEGWSKRPLSLEKRCVFMRLSRIDGCDIDKNTELGDLQVSSSSLNQMKCISALEYWLIRGYNRKLIIDKLGIK